MRIERIVPGTTTRSAVAESLRVETRDQAVLSHESRREADALFNRCKRDGSRIVGLSLEPEKGAAGGAEVSSQTAAG